MKKILDQSLNSTLSNLPTPKRIVRTPLNSGHKYIKEKIVNTPSTSNAETVSQIEYQEMLLELQALRIQNIRLRQTIEQMPIHTRINYLDDRYEVGQVRGRQRKFQRQQSSEGRIAAQIMTILDQTMKQLTVVVTKNWKGTFNQQQNLQNPLNKLIILNKDYLRHRIDLIASQPQEQRYSQLIDLFTMYYAATQQQQQSVIDNISKMQSFISSFTESSKGRSLQRIKSSVDMRKVEANMEVSLKPSVGQGQFKRHRKNKSNLVSNNQSSIKFFRRTNVPRQ